MTIKTLAAAGAFVVLMAEGPSAAQHKVLVTCTADACTYRLVASFLVSGRQSIRLFPPPGATAGANDAKGSRELNLDQVPGLYRDAGKETFYALTADGKPREVAMPAKTKDRTSAAWRSETLEYSDAPNAKGRTAIALDAFAYLLVAPDAEQATLQLLQRLIEPSEDDPRRVALIRGAVQFTAKSQALVRWRASLVARMRDELQRFDEQDGDPATLTQTVRDAAQLRGIYLQIGPDEADRVLLDRIAAAADLLDRRIAVADVLKQTKYWDEYLIKVRQLGLVKWSLPGVLENSRAALTESARLHQRRSATFAEEGHWDSAFDEAAAAARNACEANVRDEFYRARVLLVDRNQIASASEYTGRNKALLEQLVRELDQLDPAKEQLTLDRITRGEQLDPNYLPLQLKKAEFLDKLGRYREALEVVQRIERNVRLDRRQLEEYLRLDGRITNNLTDTVQKTQAEAAKQFDLQKYQLALDAAAKGLQADPLDASLLRDGALSAAFLRQNATALKLARTYLNESNLACAQEQEPGKILELYRYLSAKGRARDRADGIPHWMSGVRYRPSDVFYDPISLGFLQPVMRVSAGDGLTTIFSREDRSYLVKSISTTTTSGKSNSPAGQSTMFEVEPKYDRQALSMLEIGSRANSAGDRTSYALTYLNSPSVDPDLVRRFTGRHIARGWAGNPFFHPFIWSGLYIFDLTYDALGRVATATPIREESGARTDPFSEPLQFTWDGSSNRLMSIKGTRTGYLRELAYDKDGRLKSEAIKYPKGHGSIEYEYVGSLPQIKGARCEDNFYDRRERQVFFDSVGTTR